MTFVEKVIPSEWNFLMYMYQELCKNSSSILSAKRYRKFPKYSDTPKIVVITLKIELSGSTIE